MSSPSSAKRGLRAVLISTAIAGVLGYAIQLLAPALLEDERTYIAFSVFWSTMYLGVSAMSGIQQEVSRASHPDSATSAPTLRTFAFWASGAAVVLAVVVAVLFGGSVLPGSEPQFAMALAIGLVGYVLTAALGGVLYGLQLWRAVAFAAVADAVIRAALVIAGFAFNLPIVALAVLVACPFFLSFALTWLVFRHKVVGAFRLDVGLRHLTRNAASTVVAASASGLMISGLAMLIGLTSAAEPPNTTAGLLLAITVTRAPIVVPIIALQSFLISTVFRGERGVHPARLLRILGVSLIAITGLAVIGWIIGPWIIALISSGRYAIDGWTAAVIVMSAGLVAAMCLTGPALIAVRRHVDNTAGWIVAALLTVLALMLPLGAARVPIALTVPAIIGLAIHTFALLRLSRSDKEPTVGEALSPE